MNKEDADMLRLRAYTNIVVKCKCGCSVTMPVFMDCNICRHCGNKIYNNTELHFRYKMRKELNK